jgi:hypothetical protein
MSPLPLVGLFGQMPFQRRSWISDGVGFGSDEDGLDIPREILDYIPAQLGALHLRLEEEEAAPGKAGTPHPRRRVPTLFGRIRHIPIAIGTLADVGGAVAFVAVLGRLIGVW